MNAVVLFTYEHGKYYIETIELRDIKEVKEDWVDIFKVIDCTGDNWRNYIEVREELYNPTAKLDGQMLAVIESVFDGFTSNSNIVSFLKKEGGEEQNKDESTSQNLRNIFKYNTKNAGQQLLDLTNDLYKCDDSVSKIDMIEAIRSVGVELIRQYEEHKDKF